MKMKRIIPVILTVVILSVINSSCKQGQPTQSGSYRQLYDYDNQAIHPQYVVYHDSEDSTTVYFRIKSDNLLYTRQGAGSPFQAQVSVQVMTFDRQSAASDTTTKDLTDREQKPGSYLLSSMKIPLKSGSYKMVVNLIDKNRNANQLYFLRVDKSNTYGAQNYLLINEKTGEPFFGGFVPSGSAVEVLSERNRLASAALKAYILNTEIKLPPPPFSQNQPEIPNFENSRVVKSLSTEKSDLVFNAEDGCYLITCDPEKKTGLSFSTTSVYYPNISHTNQLPWPMRYITTKAEYDDIIKSNNSKVLIDNFWLECAGNKERAKDMIRIYYSRVEEANHFFSTYTEGWRTDRGMMHIVFGNPSKIIKQEDSETWIYGEEGQVGTLAFGFKMDSPLSNNIYILNRDPMFKTQWERMVTTWRNGRVFND